MSGTLDAARSTLEAYLQEPFEQGFDAAVETVLGDPGHQEDDFALLQRVLKLSAGAQFLPTLFQLMADEAVDPGVRLGAMRCGVVVLLNDIEEHKSGEEGTPELTQEAIADHAVGVFALAKDESAPDLLRRRSLENAAQMAEFVGSTDAVHQASVNALKSTDVLWQATGLYGLRQTAPGELREPVEQHLGSPVLELMVEAIGGLAELAGSDGDARDFKRLEDLAYDGTPDAQEAVLWALSDVEHEDAERILRESADWLERAAGGIAREAHNAWCDAFNPEPEPVEEDEEIVGDKKDRDYVDFDVDGDDDGGFGGGGGGDD